MKKSICIWALCALSVGCQKSSDKLPEPSDAILATYQALEAQDSGKFMQTLTTEKREAYQINPDALRQKLDDWKGQHAEVKILSTKKSGDTMAMVLYNVKITGRKPSEQDSILTRVLVENGEWKHGY